MADNSRLPPDDSRRELAAFIRSHRERLTSDNPAGARRRRTPGLRREEVAERAGISTTWYTWLEQGRAVSVSAHALARLAAALRLSVAERRYLFELAQRLDPEQREKPVASPRILEAVNFVAGPAYVLDRQFTALAWNKAAAQLFKGWLDARATDRNLLRFTFLTAASRTLVEDWPRRAAGLVAEFRGHCGPHLKDAPTMKLITTLEHESTEFRQLWNAGEVSERYGGRRVFRRGAKRRLIFEQLTFVPAISPGFLFVMLLPVDRPVTRRNAASG